MVVLALAAAHNATRPGSIEGVVRAEPGGAPVAGVDVYSGRIEARTDEAGRYTLRDVPPGWQAIRVGGHPRSPVAPGLKTVTIRSGQALTVDFTLPLRGVISGRIIDENDEPVPGVEVVLLGSEYGAGELRYFRRHAARTNDEGDYRIQNVRPGVAYLLLARKVEAMDAISDAPTEPRLRLRAALPTYYPRSEEQEGATPITLRGGENRENVNVRLLRGDSYCVEAQLTAAGRPAAMMFQVHPARLSFGLGPSGGVTGLPPGGKSGPDGRIRICDLHPGEYRLSAFTGDINHPAAISTIPLTIRDRDILNVTLQPVPRLPPLPVEIEWAGVPPKTPVKAKVSLTLLSMTRSFGSGAGARQITVPGKAEITGYDQPGLLLDDYYLYVRGLTGRLYLKEILYGVEEVTNAPLRPGSASLGTALQVRIGHDGGLLKAHVTDREGNPQPDATVIAMPVSAISDGALAASLASGHADQEGNYTTRALAPGKYFVFATMSQFDVVNAETISRIRSVRSLAREASVEPHATVEITLQPLELP
jgi:hypothetical protein